MKRTIARTPAHHNRPEHDGQYQTCSKQETIAAAAKGDDLAPARNIDLAVEPPILLAIVETSELETIVEHQGFRNDAFRDINSSGLASLIGRYSITSRFSPCPSAHLHKSVLRDQVNYNSQNFIVITHPTITATTARTTLTMPTPISGRGTIASSMAPSLSRQ